MPSTQIPERGPFRLVEVFRLLDRELDDAAKEILKTADPAAYHHGLGTWVRNNARFWTDGTDLVVEDIVKFRENCGITEPIPGLKMPGEVGIVNGVDCSLAHPDNASGYVLDLYTGWLNGEISEADFQDL